ncbi:50S ribosomal protein P1 [Haloarchaeobius amylolyticus]|uniref:Large ribosomal subunit protein P1 n=1 Tax=Haloarchaeobius amylolyticus TaxID=1198296 RepID=A0ABD6BCL6_9EURY
MEYVYAALILHESDEEISEDTLTDVLDAAGVDVEESRVKALVAALEDVDIEEAVSEAAVGAPAPAAPAGEAGETEAEAEEEEAPEEEPDEDEDEDEGASGEGLGELFG